MLFLEGVEIASLCAALLVFKATYFQLKRVDRSLKRADFLLEFALEMFNIERFGAVCYAPSEMLDKAGHIERILGVAIVFLLLV